MLRRLFLAGCFFVGRCHAFGGASVECGGVVCCCRWRFVVGGCWFVFVKWSGGFMAMTSMWNKGRPKTPNRAPKFAPKIWHHLFRRDSFHFQICVEVWTASRFRAVSVSIGFSIRTSCLLMVP